MCMFRILGQSCYSGSGAIRGDYHIGFVDVGVN